MFQKEVQYFWRYPNFLITECGIGGRKLDSFNRFDTIPTYIPH